MATEFQVDLDRIQISAANTHKVPNASATAASSGADLNGKAAQDACQTLKHRLVEFAAKHYEADSDSIRFASNHVQIHKDNREVWIPFESLVKEAYLNRVSLSATGFYQTPKIHYDREKARGRPFFYFAQGAACSEVEIDTLTGEYTVLRTDILHDVGTSLNPAIDIGQIEGGFIQGMGWLTTEELGWMPRAGYCLTTWRPIKSPPQRISRKSSTSGCMTIPMQKRRFTIPRRVGERPCCSRCPSGWPCGMPWPASPITASIHR